MTDFSIVSTFDQNIDLFCQFCPNCQHSDELHAVVTVDEWRDVLHDHHGFSISTSLDQLQEAVSYKLRSKQIIILS